MDISDTDVLRALTLNRGDQCAEWQAYIRDCFDWFFYRIDRIEHYIRRGLIQFEDVKDVFNVYARQIASHEQVFNDFLQLHEYNLARQFFARYAIRKDHAGRICPGCVLGLIPPRLKYVFWASASSLLSSLTASGSNWGLALFLFQRNVKQIG